MNELQQLRDRVAMLEEILGVSPSLTSRLRAAFGIPPDQARILGSLLGRQMIQFGALYNLLYGDRAEDDQPIDKVVNVQVHKLRKKLKPLGIEIATIIGEGYALRPEAKRRVRDCLARFEGEEIAPVVVSFDPLPTRHVA